MPESCWRCTKRDPGIRAELVREMSRSVIRDNYWDEMTGIARRAEASIDDVVSGNLYYDAIKAVLMACTALAVDSASGRASSCQKPRLVDRKPLVKALHNANDVYRNIRGCILSDTPTASDSLLLVTGIGTGEMAVIERTPSRAEVRFGAKGYIVVTNDYRKIQTRLSAGNNVQPIQPSFGSAGLCVVQ